MAMRLTYMQDEILTSERDSDIIIVSGYHLSDLEPFILLYCHKEPQFWYFIYLISFIHILLCVFLLTRMDWQLIFDLQRKTKHQFKFCFCNWMQPLEAFSPKKRRQKKIWIALRQMNHSMWRILHSLWPIRIERRFLRVQRKWNDDDFSFSIQNSCTLYRCCFLLKWLLLI